MTGYVLISLGIALMIVGAAGLCRRPKPEPDWLPPLPKQPFDVTKMMVAAQAELARYAKRSPRSNQLYRRALSVMDKATGWKGE